MVRTDGRTDRRTDTEGYNIIPRHTLVAGYKNGILLKCEGIIKSYLKNPKDDQNTLFLKYMYIFLTTHTVLLAIEILVAATFFFHKWQQ